MPNYTTKQCPICGKEFTAPAKTKTCGRVCGRRISKPRAPVFLPETDTYLIPLTQGKFTEIDACDVDLAKFKWNLSHGYARRNASREDGYKGVLIHREILGRVIGRELLLSEEVDHKDNNPLLNTRANLRIATHSQNMANVKVSKTNSSGYKGVRWLYQLKKWLARIDSDGITHYIGVYATPELAHAAYCEAAKKYHGEFANDGNGAINHD